MCENICNYLHIWVNFCPQIWLNFCPRISENFCPWICVNFSLLEVVHCIKKWYSMCEQMWEKNYTDKPQKPTNTHGKFARMSHFFKVLSLNREMADFVRFSLIWYTVKIWYIVKELHSAKISFWKSHEMRFSHCVSNSYVSNSQILIDKWRFSDCVSLSPFFLFFGSIQWALSKKMSQKDIVFCKRDLHF